MIGRRFASFFSTNISFDNDLYIWGKLCWRGANLTGVHFSRSVLTQALKNNRKKKRAKWTPIRLRHIIQWKMIGWKAKASGSHGSHDPTEPGSCHVPSFGSSKPCTRLTFALSSSTLRETVVWKGGMLFFLEPWGQLDPFVLAHIHSERTDQEPTESRRH